MPPGQDWYRDRASFRRGCRWDFVFFPGPDSIRHSLRPQPYVPAWSRRHYLRPPQWSQARASQKRKARHLEHSSVAKFRTLDGAQAPVVRRGLGRDFFAANLFGDCYEHIVAPPPSVASFDWHKHIFPCPAPSALWQRPCIGLGSWCQPIIIKKQQQDWSHELRWNDIPVIL